MAPVAWCVELLVCYATAGYSRNTQPSAPSSAKRAIALLVRGAHKRRDRALLQGGSFSPIKSTGRQTSSLHHVHYDCPVGEPTDPQNPAEVPADKSIVAYTVSGARNFG